MSAKRYIYCALAICLPYLLAVAWFFITDRQPFDGDLTRIGAFREAEFGWNTPQSKYEVEYNFDTSHDINDYDPSYDIVILGDSFSFRPHSSWINTLVERTDAKILLLEVNSIPLTSLLNHQAFIKNPPKYFVFQSVEKRLYQRLARLDLPEQPLGKTSSSKLKKNAKELKRISTSRPHTHNSLEAWFAQATHNIRIKLSCFIDESECRVLLAQRLSGAPPMFSSRNHVSTLFVANSVALRESWPKLEAPALSKLADLNRYFTKAPQTKFMLLVFPDRVTVYGDNHRGIEQLPALSAIPKAAEVVETPRLDLVFRAAIAQGVIDLYLPNNTHTSPHGSSLAGELAADFLFRQP